MKRLRLVSPLALLLFGVVFYAAPAFADCVPTSVTFGSNAGEVCPSPGANGNVIISLLTDLIKYLGGLVGLLVVLMIIIGGVQYIASAGNPKGVEAAKNRITNAIIALILYILMFGILNYLIPGTFIV